MKKIILLFFLFAIQANCMSQIQATATNVAGGINVHVQSNWYSATSFIGHTYSITENTIHISACYHVTVLQLMTELHQDLFIPTNESTNYNIVLTIYNSEIHNVCDYSTVLETTSVPLSNNEFNATSNIIKIFPNPSHGTLKIDANNKKIHSVKIYNMVGQLLKNFMTLENDISDLEDGTYLVILDTENGVLSKKLILKK